MASRRHFNIVIGSEGVVWLPSNEDTIGSFVSRSVSWRRSEDRPVGVAEGVWSSSARQRNHTCSACS